MEENRKEALRRIKENKKTKAKWLDLGGLGLTELPEELWALIWLEELNLGNIYSYNVTTQVWIVKELNEASLESGNSLGIIPNFIERLKNLEILYIDSNDIKKIEYLKHLEKLKLLNLESNKISDIEGISNLNKLEVLSLGFNKIVNISPIAGFHNLIELNLSYNKLTQLDNLFSDLPYLKTLVLRGNIILNVPLEVTEQENCLEDIKNWNQIIGMGEELILETNIVFLGNKGVGKTELLKTLFDEKFIDAPKVNGIDLHYSTLNLDTNSKKFHVNIWDFDGLNLFYKTCKEFLPTNCIFIIVWNKKTIVENSEQLTTLDQELSYRHNSLPFWLEHIREVNNLSPIFIVQNYSNGEEEGYPSNPTNTKNWQELYKVKFRHINYNSEDSVNSFKSSISGLISDFPFLQSPIPEKWIPLKKELITLRTKNPSKTLLVRDFYDLCKNKNIEPRYHDTILSFFHFKGFLYYFPNLPENRIFLDLKKALYGIYQLFDKSRKGSFYNLIDGAEIKFKAFYQLWPELSNEYIDLLFSVMEKSRLSYRFVSEKEISFMLPDLFPDDNPELIDYVWPDNDINNLYIKFDFDFPSIDSINNFLVKLSGYSKKVKGRIWKTGIWITDINQKNEGLVLIKRNEKIILFRAKGESPVDLLMKMESCFEESIYYTETVNKYVSNDGSIFINFEQLINPISVTELSISSLEGKIVNKKDYKHFITSKNIEPIPVKDSVKIFISYSHLDEVYKDRLRDELIVLDKTDAVDIWDDRELTVGSNFDEKILNALEKADIICFMVSINFIKSAYIWDRELKRALELEKNGTTKIAAIILGKVPHFKKLSFSHLTALPKDAKPILSFEDQESAWDDVNDGLTRLIEEIQAVKSSN